MTRLKKSVLLTAIALALFSVGRIALFLTHQHSFDSLDTGTLIKGFIGGIRFDLSIILTLCVLPLLMLNIPWKKAEAPAWAKAWGWLMYLIVVASILLLIGDIIYFGYVDRHVGRELLVLSEDWGFIFKIAFEDYLHFLALFVLFAAALFMLWNRILSAQPVETGKGGIKFAIIVLVLFLCIRGTTAAKSINIVDAYSGGEAALGNLTLNGVFTAYHVMRSTKKQDYRFYGKDKLYGILNIPQTEFPLAKAGKKTKVGYNVVFVLLESWSFKYIDSFAGTSYGVTPYFDSLSKESVVFPHFYAATQRSIGGIQATLTGIPTMPGMPILSYGLEMSKITLIGSFLEKNGYETLFVVSSPRRSFRLDAVSNSLGFRHYFGKEDMPILLPYPDPKAADYGWDYETYMFLKNKIDAARKPFFAFTFTGTTHEPFPNPGKKFEKYEYIKNHQNAFLDTLYYSDWSLGQFIEACKKVPWFDNTIFMFTADHAMPHFLSGPFDEKFHTPFMIYAPKILKPRTIDVVSSQLDIMPTIMDILGVDGEYSAVGESVLSKRNGVAVSTEDELVAIFTDKGYLRHSLKGRLETGGVNGNLPPEEADKMEQQLLARYQISYDLLTSNKFVK
jgi:phosphoglycerol transferase MdoB-like AlkP superfamily enzyme